MLFWEEGATDDNDMLESEPGIVALSVSFPPPTSFKPKSQNFLTLSTNPNIWAFVQQITTAINNMDLANSYPLNLSAAHRKALKSLQRGGNVVVMDTALYERMCYDILGNREMV